MKETKPQATSFVVHGPIVRILEEHGIELANHKNWTKAEREFVKTLLEERYKLYRQMSRPVMSAVAAKRFLTRTFKLGTTGHEKNKVEIPPGIRMMSLLRFVYSKKKVELVFEPLLADFHKEYFDALKNNETWKARWIRARYLWEFTMTIGIDSAISTIKKIVKVMG